ncbi:MAG: hypothetical protein KGI57_04565, partial [Hyphomicrobiales bacterium]|nr:hypothetical protein [Hyphomicrobiales bacterium]
GSISALVFAALVAGGAAAPSSAPATAAKPAAASEETPPTQKKPPVAKVEAPKPARACFPVARARAKIRKHKLVNPFGATALAARVGHGEAVQVVLCKFGADFRYVVVVLRRNGTVIRVAIDAETGRPIPRRKPAQNN